MPDPIDQPTSIAEQIVPQGSDRSTDRERRHHDAVLIPGAPQPRGPYPHAHVHGSLVWVTGQIGRDPASGQIVGSTFAEEFDQAITNLEAILEASGTSLSEVIRTEVQFVDAHWLDDMNAVYGRRFAGTMPARTSYGAAFLWKGARVQISCVAALPAGQQDGP